MKDPRNDPKTWSEVPEGWEAEKDIDQFDAIFGPIVKPYPQMLDLLATAYEESLTGLRAAYKYFAKRQTVAGSNYQARLGLTMPPGCIVNFILSCVAVSSREQGYRERFEEWAKHFRFALTEHDRIVSEFMRSGENSWLFPLVQLHDFIASCTYDLMEAMSCEHDDFS